VWSGPGRPLRVIRFDQLVAAVRQSGGKLLTTLCLMSHKDKTTVAYDTRLMMSPVTLRYAA
jgi:hypothetical protein